VLIQSTPDASEEPHRDKKKSDLTWPLARRIRRTLKDSSLSEEDLVSTYQSRYQRSLVQDLLKACEIVNEDVETIRVPDSKEPLFQLSEEGLAQLRRDDPDTKTLNLRRRNELPPFYLLTKALERAACGPLCNAVRRPPTGRDIGAYLIEVTPDWKDRAPYDTASRYARAADRLGLVKVTSDPADPKDWTVEPTERLMLLRLLGRLHVAQRATNGIFVTPAQFVNALLPDEAEQTERDETMLRFAFGFDNEDFIYDGTTCTAELSSEGREVIAQFMKI